MKIRLLLGFVLLASILMLLEKSPARAERQAGVPGSLRAAVGAGNTSLSSVTLSLPAVADVTLAAEFPDENFQDPSFPFLEVDYWHDLSGVLTFVRIFLIRFDLTGLPPDAIIDSATLQLHWNSCTLPGTYPVSFGAYFVNSPWSESTVTYNSRPSWASVGMSSQVSCPTDDPTTWNVTSFAQAWQSDPAHNYGVKVSGPWATGYDYSVAFNSREYSNNFHVPELVITYHLPLPGPFSKTSPANGATGQLLSLSLQWGASSNFNSYQYCYDTNNNGACDSSWISNGTGTSASISGLAAGTIYYWQVRAVNAYGVTYANGGVWWSFTTGNTPGSFNKSSPSSGATNQLLSLTLSWGASSGVSSYAYCYDTTNDSTCDGSWTDNAGNTSAAISGLSQGTTYYWQVIAHNSFGVTLADSDLWWSFTTTNTLKNTFRSAGGQDGWNLESSELSGKGGTLNATAITFNLGDDAADRQYRAILSFNTGGLPDNAVITKATLKIKRQGIVGTNPFNTHSGLKVDIRKPYFGGSAALAISDFQAAANKNAVATFNKTSATGAWYTAVLSRTAYPYINLKGTTQFRLRFAKDDNDDRNADYLKFYSGNAAVAYRPVLAIEYYVP